MMLFTNVRVAVESLRSTRIRTALTILGMVIGVASITLVLSLGEGAKHAVQSQVKELDENVVVVRPGKVERDQKGSIIDYSPLSSYAVTTLTENDLESAAKNKYVSAVAPIMIVNGSIKNGKISASSSPIVATSPELGDILQLKAKQGQFLDGTTARDTVVIGEQLSIDLYGTDQSIGRQLKIRGRDHTVIGVLEKVKNPLGINGINFDTAAIVSLEDGKSFNQGIAQIQQLTLKAKDTAQLPELKKTLSSTLLANHEGEEDFAVLGGKEAAEVSGNFFEIIAGITTAVATVSLIVGGIGIMNIMLVGVAERTREIGIRKSLGASNPHILSQFLIESLIMSLLGGIFGFIIAVALAYAMSIFLAFQPVFTWQIFGLAFGVSLVVGLIFGIFPAIRAAKKDPIVALRQHH